MLVQYIYYMDDGRNDPHSGFVNLSLIQALWVAASHYTFTEVTGTADEGEQLL